VRQVDHLLAFSGAGTLSGRSESILSIRAEPEQEVTMSRKVIFVTVVVTVVRAVIASASPVVDAVLVALAVLLLATAWDKFTNARP
jgi:hypothetical protein